MGVSKYFGPRGTDQKFGGRTDDDIIKHAIWTFNYDDLPVYDANNENTFSVPSGAIILEAYFVVLTAFAGGTSYDIDFVDNANAAIGTGKDKLWDALLLTEIDTSTVGTAVLSSTHTGTNSGNVLAGIAAAAEFKLASAGQLSVVATGTFTAGVGQIIVKYFTPGALPA